MTQIQLSERSRKLIEQELNSGEFDSPDDVVEHALDFFATFRVGAYQPIDPATGADLSDEELRSLIQAGLDDEAQGRVGSLDIEDVKRRGRERLAARQSQEQHRG
jgi:hypothetical protein